MSIAELEARVTDLELRWMRERDRVDELSTLVFEQSRVIERLERAVEQLRAQQETGGTDVIVNDPPPHY